MTAEVSNFLGFIGTIIVGIGYLPQIVHMARERCSAGVSISARFLWLLSSLLIATHAFVVFDVVFISLQIVNILAGVVVIVLAKEYRGMFCLSHKGLAVK
jgi:uncharacterized protein with PQ loop repeat